MYRHASLKSAVVTLFYRSPSLIFEGRLVGSLCRQIWRGKEIGMRKRKGTVGCEQAMEDRETERDGETE